MESTKSWFGLVRLMREHSVATALVLWVACLAPHVASDTPVVVKIFGTR